MIALIKKLYYKVIPQKPNIGNIGGVHLFWNGKEIMPPNEIIIDDIEVKK